MDYYLKFASEEEAKALLYRDEVACYANIDIIGEIPDVIGWHVNVRLIGPEDGAVLEPYAVSPATPIRIWG